METPYPTFAGVVEEVWCPFFTMRHGSRLYRVCLQKDVNDARPQPGEAWQVSGEPYVDEANKRYGWQLLAHEAKMVMPSSELLIDFLALQFDGIGQAKAGAMWRSAINQSVDLVQALNNGWADQLATLVDKKNRQLLSSDFISTLLRRWQELLAEAKGMLWMQTHGLSKTLARRAREAWGADAIDAIEENPYRLLAFAPYHKTASAFAKVDLLAIQKLNIGPDDSRRLLAAFECAMYQEWDNGSTAVTLDRLNSRLDSLLSKTRVSTSHILSNADAHRAVAQYSLSDNDSFVQLRGVALIERQISERFVDMIERRERYQDNFFISEFNETSLGLFETATCTEFALSTFSLNEGQKSAVKMAVEEPLSVITGDAGTGKTTVLKAVFDQILSQGGSVFAMAPTGKAAKRLRESTQQKHASTIAKFIQDRKNRRVVPQAGSHFVIDEASMVDTPTLYELLKHIPKGSSIVFVGDPFQLPPIGAGLTFHILVKSTNVPKTILSEIHRAAAETGIPAASKNIREQRMPPMERIRYQSNVVGRMISGNAGILFIDADKSQIKDAIVRAYREMNTKGEVQIIAAINRATPEKPPVGVENLNQILQQVYRNPNHKVLEIGEYRKFGEGDPVMFTRNIHSRDLWNGSMGRLVKIFHSPKHLLDDLDGEQKNVEVVAIAELDGIERQLSRADFDHIELAYAVTCHKAQGSSFDCVIVVAQDSTVMDNTWFYTAFTRARKQVVVIGDWDAMRKHVTLAPRSFGRTVGLKIER